MTRTRLINTGGLIIAGQASIALLGILTLRIYTEFAPAQVFGESNLVLGALGLGLQVFIAAFTSALLRFYSDAHDRGTRDRFTRETLHWVYRSIALLIGLLLLVVAAMRLLGRTTYGTPVISAGVFWIVAIAVRNVLMSRIQAQRRQQLYVSLQVVEAILAMLFTTISLQIAASIESFMVGQALGGALLIALILRLEPDARAAFRLQARDSSGLMPKALAYGMPFAPLSALNWLGNQGDRYTLAWLLGAEATGRYVAPFSIASRGMSLASISLCDLFRPILFEAENRRDGARARRTFLQWILASASLSALGLLMIFLFGEFIVGLMLAADYRASAVAIMLWVAAGYAVSGITQVLENRLLSLGHSAQLIAPMVFGALANVGLSILLVTRHGIVGRRRQRLSVLYCSWA